ncbi:uncharacterized protein LOC122395682 [Colletes gigas]|uniref:uncharacterized protein LOC122395682 n=1 Tax=Colletes gigas TaxID=935657 RepID=UPI001C9A805F|nr:uncharacterized protein LOC122395682 [Colletes gigas]
MAGIFNLFGGISDLDKGQVTKSLSRSKTSLGVSETSVKSFNQLKPKGLSIRSSSDINVSASLCLNNSNQDVSNKQQDCLKLKPTQSNNGSCSLSPRKEFPAKKQNDNPIEIKRNVKHLTSQKTFNDHIFKKPLTPKKLITKSYPEPERLAPYYDEQSEFDNVYRRTIENDFKELFLKKENEMLLHEDEGFESDPEPLELELPKLHLSSESIEEEYKKCWIPDLPNISDDNDI